MKRINHLLYEPVNWGYAEHIKAEVPALSHLNNANVVFLWEAFRHYKLPADQEPWTNISKDELDLFWLWLNETL